MKTAWRIGWKVALALWICVALSALVAFRSFSIPSASMIPTLWPGDYVAVSTTAYGVSKYSLPGQFDLFEGRRFAQLPTRGDVVVFAFPSDPRTSWVKRIVGLPGDTIQLKAGRLFINGTVVPREPAPKVRTGDLYGHETEVATYKETLPGGGAHMIVEIQGDNGFNDNTDVFTVPAGSYFMLGDNRDNSTDSRTLPGQGGLGYVPFENLIGRVELVVFSSSLKQGPNRAFPRRVH